MGIKICTDLQCVVDWLYTWQTLVSGVLALVAAAGTIFLLWLQIDGESRRHREERAAKTRAARAALPDALSEVAAYTRQCLMYLLKRTDEVPSPPEQGMSTIKWAIEFCGDSASQALFALAGKYQIQRARIIDHDRSRSVETLDRALDCLELRALSDRLYPYGRGTKDEVKTEAPHPDELIHCIGQFAGPDDPLADPELRQQLRDRIRGGRAVPTDDGGIKLVFPKGKRQSSD